MLFYVDATVMWKTWGTASQIHIHIHYSRNKLWIEASELQYSSWLVQCEAMVAWEKKMSITYS